MKFEHVNSAGYLATIKNDKGGQQLVKNLRSHFKGAHKIILRGRGHRKGIKRYRQSLPLSLASHWAVYIQ